MGYLQRLPQRLLRRLAPSFACVLLFFGFVHARADAAQACPPLPRLPTAEENAAAQRDYAGDRGLLWRITRDGHTSYLYGTIHVGKLAWAYYGEQMSQALRSSDVLALELDPLNPQLAAESAAALAKIAPEAVVLPPAVQARLQQAWSHACIPPEAVAALGALHPALQLSTLTGFVARRDGLEVIYGQEFVLAGLAQRFARPIVGLETIEQQLRVLIPTDRAELERGTELGLTLIENGRARATIVRLSELWERGDLAGIEGYTQWCDCINTEADRAVLRALNDDRNPNLAAGIDKLHREGKRVFAAVGALHMSGEKALPKLFAELGYTVERVVFAAPTTR